MKKLLFFFILLWVRGPASALISAEERLLTKTLSMYFIHPVRLELGPLAFNEVPKINRFVVLSSPPVGMVSFRAIGQSGETKTGMVFVRVYARVAIAKTSLKHLELIEPQKVIFEEREIGPLMQIGYFVEKQDLVGRRVRGSIGRMHVIHELNTVMRKLVERNEPVEIQFTEKNLIVSGKMKSLESGDLGAWVRILNPTTKKSFHARVVGEGKVEIK